MRLLIHLHFCLLSLGISAVTLMSVLILTFAFQIFLCIAYPCFWLPTSKAWIGNVKEGLKIRNMDITVTAEITRDREKWRVTLLGNTNSSRVILMNSVKMYCLFPW